MQLEIESGNTVKYSKIGLWKYGENEVINYISPSNQVLYRGRLDLTRRTIFSHLTSPSWSQWRTHHRASVLWWQLCVSWRISNQTRSTTPTTQDRRYVHTQVLTVSYWCPRLAWIWISIGSGNGSVPNWNQGIPWTIAGLSSEISYRSLPNKLSVNMRLIS